ncbi:MAG TPA: CDP-alcohol phosphatidyltransferase family protein [Mycobacteriales bacterium]|nr:CDP-alcohol phosphatidyltransferase family protein [Mycobacteriales bacterium]
MGAGRLIPDRDEYLRRWSALHSGLPPSKLVRRWLVVCYFCARPLVVLRVAPLAVTVTGLLLSGAAPALCVPAGGWVFLATALTVLSGVLDNLDGALAALLDRATGFGAVADSLADRLADTAYLLALWLLGAPGWLVGLAAGLTFLQEYLRARGAGLGAAETAVITVWERPTRVILVAGLLLGCGLNPAQAGGIATTGAAVAVGFAVVALAQLVHSLRRLLAPKAP